MLVLLGSLPRYRQVEALSAAQSGLVKEGSKHYI
jgi:hypothetical protein